MKRFFQLLIAGLFFFSCNKERFELQTLIINDHRVDCIGEARMKCLLVKHRETDNWQYFYDPIEGFEYEPGYVYRIEVKVYDVPEPLADQSSKRYVLKRLISKQ